MRKLPTWLAPVLILIGTVMTTAAEEWPQLKFDGRHSGDVADRSVTVPLGLIGAVPLTDGVFTSPVVADGRVYVVDGSGAAFGIDATTCKVLWKRETSGGKANCNNVSSPAVSGKYLHFGTMAGSYCVLDTATGELVREISCGAPIFASPIVANERVYFVTLGSQVYALEPDGTVCWKWDYLQDHVGFAGDRFQGADWLKHNGGRVTRSDQFCCAWNPAIFNKTLVIPAGGAVVWLDDAGDQAAVRAVHVAGTPTLGLSIDSSGAVYRQWHHLDNGGQVDVLRLNKDQLQTGSVPGTRTSTRGGLLSFCSVSFRGQAVFRCRPEEGFGLCRHDPAQPLPERLGTYPSVASPIVLRDNVVYVRSVEGG